MEHRSPKPGVGGSSPSWPASRGVVGIAWSCEEWPWLTQRGQKRSQRPNPGAASQPAWLANALGWAPRKIKEGRAFLSEVRAELKKVTWPSLTEVYSTTVVVIATTVFFGFYLWLLDLGFSRALSHVLKG